MKTRLFFLAAAMFAAHLSTAQVLYTEDFENYNTSLFSTDSQVLHRRKAGGIRQ